MVLYNLCIEHSLPEVEPEPADDQEWYGMFHGNDPNENDENVVYE